jgi:membrane-associated protease RseP (regulator of RpoE activity)
MNAHPHDQHRIWLHLILFLLTFVTTTVAGAIQECVDPLANPLEILSGLPFALTLMLILLVHEMGHYLTSRYYNVKATLPYFIPGPSFIGTFGAFIKMQSQMPDRRTLFDIGASGPLAGLVFSIPAVVLGLQLSTIEPAEPSACNNIIFGSSLLFRFLTKETLGFFPAHAFTLHPVATAGWVGLFVTAMNLLPAGQLDGGHVNYALFGRRYIWLSRLTVLAILLLGVTRWSGWLIWGVLLLFMGVRHPPPVDSETPLDAKRKLLGWLLLATLFVTFMPIPFAIWEPEPREQRREPETPETLQRTRGLR